MFFQGHPPWSGQQPFGGQPHGIDPMQALFGHGHAAPDPELLQQFFMGGGGGFPMPGFHMQQQQSQEQRKEGPPPTSASALRSLPRIKVTAYDIAANESAECSICLDELVAGQPALRIPCGHLYHEDCVKDWLRKSNECPVCRFELPTDDAEYERGRRQRMAGRQLRMRRLDLTVKTVQELSRLANFIGVDVRGCLEKSELVERIAASSQVQIIPTEGMDASASSQDASAAVVVFTRSQLEALSIGEVQALMERLSVDTSDCRDKGDLIARLVLSGRVLVTSDSDDRGQSGTMGAAPAASATAAADTASARSPSAYGAGISLAGKSVSELRQVSTRLASFCGPLSLRRAAW